MRIRTQEREVKQPILPKIKESKKSQKEVKILNLAVHLEKLTAQLNDGRELSIPMDWFAKWGVEGVNAEKLRKYEIWEGGEIYFPEIDEVLGIEIFTGVSCWMWVIMPTWKISGYQFYFLAGEPLKKNKDIIPKRME